MSVNNEASLVSLLEKKAQEKPDFPLYTFLQGSAEENKILTYGGLAEQARKIAVILQKITSPGDRVVIIYPPGLELISAFFGCLYAGVVTIPVYPPATKDLVAKLQHIIKNSGAQIVLTTQGILQQIKKLRMAKWVSRHDMLHRAAQRIVGPSFNRSLQLLDWDFEKMHFIVTDHIASTKGKGWIQPQLCGKSLAFLQYTSGSTGKPKGVMVSHGNLINNLKVTEARHHAGEEDVCVSWLPPYHDMGLIAGILQPMYSSFPVKLMSPLTFLQRPAVWLEAMTEFKGTITGAPNFAYDLCITKVTETEKIALDLSHWKIAATGAEPIRSTTIDRFATTFADYGFHKEAFYPCYGLAESTLMVTAVGRSFGVKSQIVDNKALSQGKVSYCEENHPDARRLVNCGSPADNFEIMIVHPDTGVPCADGEVGEIWVHGDSVTQGYWELPSESKHCFQAQLPHDERTFLRTGDFGYMSQGELYVTGRLKDMIIIRGRNYYPHDLEHTIHNCHPELRVNCCAIFSMEEQDKELLVVVQEVRNKLEPQVAEEVVRIIRSNILQVHGIAADVVVLTGHKSVPKTTSGKIQRLLCKQRYQDGILEVLHRDGTIKEERPAAESTKEFVEGTHLSKLLKPILEQNLEEIDTAKKLTELGVNSLKLAELQYVLTRLTGTTISMEYLLMDPALKDILALLEGKEKLEHLAQHNQVDLVKEFERYKDIKVDAVHRVFSEPQKAFLTGATGFLGAYLLKEFLDNTSWEITCLVQANTTVAGIERVVKNLQTYALWKPEYQGRIQVVLGNLEKEHLGLHHEVWEQMAAEMDLIIHSAAILNFIYPYQKMKASNVLGTRQILELAGHHRLKAVHYVSTIGYFWSSDLRNGEAINEQSFLRVSDGIYGGYNQTKWLAEQLMSHARTLHIPTVIYRPSLITGSSETGHWNQADVICRIIKGCSLMGVRPLLNESLNLVPVDYVARSIAYFAKERPYQSNTFHLLNQEYISFNESFKHIEAMGLAIKPIAYESWLQKVREYGGAEDSLFAPLRPFFTEKVINKDASLFELYIHKNKVKVDCSYTKEQLANAGIHCVEVDAHLLAKYLNYLNDCGYFKR